MIDLKEQIEKLVLEEELSSLKYFAASLGISEMDIISEVFERFRSDMDSKKSFYQKELKKDNVEHLIGESIFKKDSVESPEEFFAYYKEIEKYYKQSCIDTIITTIPNIFKKAFPVGFEDINKIRSLHSFLDQIPLINTFDKTEFDQNVILEVGNEDVYVIRNYFLLDALLTYYICPLFINTTFVSKERFDDKGPDFYHERQIARKFLEVFEKYKNNKIYSVESLEEWAKDDYYRDYNFATTIYNLDLYYGIKFFAFFHEYSHIILNHFNSSSSNFKIELDADILAINLLATNTLDYYKNVLNTNEVYNQVAVLRIISPLLYFLFKISFEEGNLSLSPSYFIRFKNAKEIIDNLLLLNSLQDLGLRLTSKIETILLQVYELKQITFESIRDKVIEEQKIVDKEIVLLLYSRLKGLYQLQTKKSAG